MDTSIYMYEGTNVLKNKLRNNGEQAFKRI